MLRPRDLRLIIQTAPVYKMSLGQSAVFEAESIDRGALVMGSEARFHDAVMSGDPAAIAHAGALIKSDTYPKAGAPENAWRIWAGNIRTFLALQPDTVVIHWSASEKQLYWGIVGDAVPVKLREETDSRGQRTYIFTCSLREGWRTTSINDVSINALHPKARDLAINQATINLVRTDTDFFRALLVDAPTDAWTSRPEWAAAARKDGWHPKRLETLIREKREQRISPQVIQVVNDFEDDVRRMAQTALQTVEYANGQTVIRIVKPKDTDLTREELEEEIARLFKSNGYRCALTDYDFNKPTDNKHLRPSLDRIDSALGYVYGNLQVVTRAANFFKSASDAADWAEKCIAMEKMAIALQRKRKATSDP